MKTNLIRRLALVFAPLAIALVAFGAVASSALATDVGPGEYNGIHMIYGNDAYTDMSVATHGTWARVDAFWNDMEPNSGEYTFNAITNTINVIKNDGVAGDHIILLVKRTPGWARPSTPVTQTWLPPAENRLVNLEYFMHALVDAVGPSTGYGIKYFEMFNEPEIDPSKILDWAMRPHYGGWGSEDTGHPAHGGDHYGHMLIHASAGAKNANANVKIIAGALMMQDDTANHYTTEFITGFLNYSGVTFDAVSLHNYETFGDAYVNGTAWYQSDFNNPGCPYYCTHTSQTEAPGRIGFVRKVDFMRLLLANAGKSSTMPIFVDETGLVVWDGERDGHDQEDWYHSPEYGEQKAYYAAQSMAMAIAKNVVLLSYGYASSESDHRGWSLYHDNNDPPLHYAYTATHVFNDVLGWDGANTRVWINPSWTYFDNDNASLVRSGSSTNLQGIILHTYSTSDPNADRPIWQISMATMTPNTNVTIKPKWKVHHVTNIMGQGYDNTTDLAKCYIGFDYYPMYSSWEDAVQYLEFQMPLSECP